MSDAIQIDSNARELIADLAKQPGAVQRGVVRAVGAELLALRTKVIQGASLKWRRGNAGLAGRITSYSKMDGDIGFSAAIGFRKTKGFPYELAQETGAKAKPGKAMAIPVTNAARAAGSPRAFPGVLFIPRGTHVLAKAKVGKKGTGGVAFEVQYVLVKSIPARLGFRKTIAANTDGISGAVVRGWKEGWRAA